VLESLSTPKQLPHSEESERAVLAGILVDPSWLDIVGGQLRPEDFYLERHQLIYRAMLELGAELTPADVVTLHSHLEERGLAERAGGLAYLAGLDVDLPDLSRIEAYTAIIRDRSGRRALLEGAATAMRAVVEGGAPLPEICSRLAQQIEGALAGTSSAPASMLQVLDAAVAAIEAAAKRGDGLAGMSTGLPSLDRLTLGLCPGQLVIVAGRPGMGKSVMAQQLALAAAVAGHPVLWHSAEMSKVEVGQRLLSSASQVPLEALRTGHLAPNQYRQIHEAGAILEQLPIHLDEACSPSPQHIQAQAVLARRRQGLGLVVVDYLGLMALRQDRGVLRDQAIGEATRALKRLAGEMQVPVVLLCQLNRGNEAGGGTPRAPRLSDLRESGNIEQDADMVLFVHRPGIYDPGNPELAGKASIIVAKNRNGSTGECELAFDGRCVSLREPYSAAAGMAPPF
jgi:replicative DNA helicase